MNENHIANVPDMTMSEKQVKAISLHKKILANGQIAAEALVELAKNLKEMRDSKLYIELGHESFDDYCEKSAHIRQRQAYKFIKALEEFGEQKLLENSGLGITKLAALATLCEEDREAIMSSENVQGLSSRELEEKIAELKKRCEQLTFEIESREETAEEVKARLETEKRELAERIAILETENKSLKNRPAEVKAAASKEEIDKIKTTLADEMEEIKEREIKKYKSDKKNAEREKAKSDEKVKALEKQIADLQASAKADKDTKTAPASGCKELLKYHFNSIQTAFNSAAEIIGKQEQAEEKDKLKKAAKKLLSMCEAAIEEV